jgi:hypothetical protein
VDSSQPASPPSPPPTPPLPVPSLVPAAAADDTDFPDLSSSKAASANEATGPVATLNEVKYEILIEQSDVKVFATANFEDCPDHICLRTI